MKLVVSGTRIYLTGVLKGVSVAAKWWVKPSAVGWMLE